MILLRVGEKSDRTVWAFGSIAEAVAELPFLRALKLLQREIEDLPHHLLFRPGDPIAVVLQNKHPDTPLVNNVKRYQTDIIHILKHHLIYYQIE